MRRFFKGLLLSSLLLWAVGVQAAEGPRLVCGAHTVLIGDNSETVKQKCGPPDEEKTYQSPIQRGQLGILDGEQAVMIWSYDRFSSEGFKYHLHFEDGILKQIDKEAQFDRPLESAPLQ